jgi:5-methyltetrahydrofolate--homocysteine methyltransferase
MRRGVMFMSEQNSTIFERIRDSILCFDSDGLVKVCNDALAAGIPPVEIINKGIASGTQVIGSKFEKGEFYLSDLIMAGETIKSGMKIIEPHVLDKDKMESAPGRVVIGTVEGDMHDIGKGIVTMFLQAAGFDIIDLGVDVPARKFIAAVRRHTPIVVGMSALMTTSMDQMKAVMNQLKKSQLKKKVKVIIGGAPITSSYAEQIGADAGTNDAVRGVETIKAWMANRG